jgi:hypothetical protein
MQRKFPLQTHLLVINCSLLLLLILLMLFLSCSKIVDPVPISNNNSDLTTPSTGASINFSFGANSFYSPFVYTGGSINILSYDASGGTLELNFSMPVPTTSDTLSCVGTIIYHTSELSLECDNATFTFVLQDSTISGGFYGVNWMLDQTTAALQRGSGNFANVTLP